MWYERSDADCTLSESPGFSHGEMSKANMHKMHTAYRICGEFFYAAFPNTSVEVKSLIPR